MMEHSQKSPNSLQNLTVLVIEPIIENVAKDTSKGSLFDCQEDVPYTALTIV